MKLAVVGITGMVGQAMCKVLAERNFSVQQFIPVASERSVGKEVFFKGTSHTIVSIDTAIELQPDIVIFSAGGDIALAHAPRFAAVGTRVVDNSSAFRMDKEKPLIVPEVNIEDLKESDLIIANPNCSTIQLMVALKPLEDLLGIERLVISTYQSMTGTGVKAVRQYEDEKTGRAADNPAYPHPIYQNCIPHCDVFFDNGYTKEELKLVNESQKILNRPDLRVTATAVRVPVTGGHSESVNITFKKDFDIDEVIKVLKKSPGLTVLDNPLANEYPMPLNAQNKDEVFVGRIRRDYSADNTLNLWIVADNLRKGAATNAVQIAEHIVQKGWVLSKV
jgi:aspartate-semialdehyde dehydrogenase